MDIQWHGLSCFTIKGKSGTVVTDPFDPVAAGVKLPKLEADIVLANVDLPFHHAVDKVSGDKQVFDWPGEYESKGIIVQAITAYDRPREKEEGKKDNANRVLIFTIEVDGFNICHLSNIGHKPTSEMQEMIGDVDILLVPIGGVNCLDVKKAHEVVEQLEPRIVIPMYYKTAGVKLPLGELSAFLKEMGLPAVAAEKVLKFQTPANLPQEKTEFKVLEAAVG